MQKELNWDTRIRRIFDDASEIIRASNVNLNVKTADGWRQIFYLAIYAGHDIDDVLFSECVYSSNDEHDLPRLLHYLVENGCRPPLVSNWEPAQIMAGYAVYLADDASEAIAETSSLDWNNGFDTQFVLDRREHAAACLVFAMDCCLLAKTFIQRQDTDSDEDKALIAEAAGVAAKDALSESSRAASALAQLRHRETREMADMVRDYWKLNIDPSLSAQRAADEVIKANLVNLSHKKLAEIISAEKKKQP